MSHFAIVCVKIGTKYPSYMVNNLYRMCTRHMTHSFDFFCYTDDAEGLCDSINVISFVDHGLDVVVYNKLYLFSESMDKHLPRCPRLYFDLDLVIKGNIDDLANVSLNPLTVIDAEWRQKHDYGFPIFHHPFNSSCMLWEPARTKHVWEYLMQDPERFMNKYHWGMDSFLFYEKESIPIEIGYFTNRKFYSYLYGIDYEENVLHDPITKGYRPSKFVETAKKIPIVLLNGPTTMEDYNRVYKRYYTD
jgi:hypothetical protein